MNEPKEEVYYVAICNYGSVYTGPEPCGQDLVGRDWINVEGVHDLHVSSSAEVIINLIGGRPGTQYKVTIPPDKHPSLVPPLKVEKVNDLFVENNIEEFKRQLRLNITDAWIKLHSFYYTMVGEKSQEEDKSIEKALDVLELVPDGLKKLFALEALGRGSSHADA